MSGARGDELTRLRQRMVEIERQIAEALERLPAHSIKPSLMQELLLLEDERDRLVSELGRLRAKEQRPDG